MVSEFVTLDGVIEAPGGEPGHPHTGWAMDFMGPEQERYKPDEVLAASALLLGRVTYESFADAWPERSGGFADKMNSMPKHVVSTTGPDLTWEGSELLGPDVAKEVRRLKQEDGGPLLVAGSGTLVATLLQDGLVDELRLMVFPVVLGSGRRLLPDSPDTIVLRLAGTQAFDTGVVVQTYRSVAA